MVRMKRIVATMLLLLVVCLGTPQVFADGPTETPAATNNGPITTQPPTVDGPTETPAMIEALIILVTDLIP